MQILIAQASKQNPIGNTVAVATLFKGKKEIGRCMDTPNAIAAGMFHTGATRAVNGFGERVTMTKKRIQDNHGMSLASICFTAK